MLTWGSNPYAYGARMEGRKSSVGGLSNVNGAIKANLFGDTVYYGNSEEDAMKAVQEALDALPLGVIRALKDDLPNL